ncbi:unnamed protein product [Prorocentrum cordatum]|uniref:S1 motif domain-containing protein n=1 Tax=Prorocentrum cordatum TaxID=2364126 RepID=A0ABN9XLM0_9DINO|nr:unnamed protein product [Polarella glacialis]
MLSASLADAVKIEGALLLKKDARSPPAASPTRSEEQGSRARLPPRAVRGRAPAAAGRGGRAAVAAALAVAASVLLRGWPASVPAWLAGAPARRRAPARSARPAAAEAPTAGRPVSDLKVGETLEGRVAFRNTNGVYVDVGVFGTNGFEKNGAVFAPTRLAKARLAPNQTVSATVERVEGDKFWVSVDGVPKLRLLKDLSVGETLEGFVALMRKGGAILIDVGAERLASTLAQRSEFTKLKIGQQVVTTVEKLDGEDVWVSVAGLTKARLSADLQVGEKLEGKVVQKKSDAVLIDVGCELIAKAFAPRKDAQMKLEPNQTVSVTVERVQSRSILVAVEGLPKPIGPKAGETLTGKVAYKSRDGVFVDIGFAEEARVFAPKLLALDTLEKGQTVTATVEETGSRSIWVSVEGLPKMRMIEDLKEGEVIEGVVAKRSQHAVYLDIGSMAMARVLAPRDDALAKLEYKQVVNATIERVRSKFIVASVPGLPKLNFSRRSRRVSRSTASWPIGTLAASWSTSAASVSASCQHPGGTCSSSSI